MLFSIIIPVYNIEAYLMQCVDSVLAQTFDDFEVLLIDDGSTDGSGALCDACGGDSRVRVFHKENGGLSDARNYGMARARGDYYVFVDSDDWIEPDALENLLRTLDTPVDLVITTLIEYFDNDQTQRVNDTHLSAYLQNHPITKENAVEWVCKHSQNAWPAQKTVVSAAFVKKHGLRFAKGRLHEDVDWTSRCLYAAESFAFMTQPWYYHRLNRFGSIMDKPNVKNSIDMIEMARQHLECPKGLDETLHKQILKRFMCSLYACLRRGKKNSKQDRHRLAECMKKNKCLFTLSNAPKAWNKVFVIIYKLFGARAALWLLRYI